ncbi:hypothetical protein QUB70_20235 [Microcoleus sp. A003_D6]
MGSLNWGALNLSFVQSSCEKRLFFYRVGKGKKNKKGEITYKKIKGDPLIRFYWLK